MTALSDYKRGLIRARTQLYNANLASLMLYYQGLINAVNANPAFSRGVKYSRANALMRVMGRAVLALKAKYKADVAVINRITVAPIVQRTVPANIALLIGINYIGTVKQLRGCINDTVVMSTLLKSEYGYSASNISFMTDNTVITPTRANIIKAFTDLLKNSIPGDKLFFFYSGHGTQRGDPNNPNPFDKIAECIYPLDGNVITDVTFKSIIDANMKDDVRLTTIFDSCFSGTIMNLKYNYLYNNGVWVSETNAYNGVWVSETNAYNVVTKGTVVCISGSKDDQLSEDAYINGKFDGALTWALSTTISEATPPLSWTQLMENMRSLLATNTFTQLPQFSSDDAIDMEGTVIF